MDIDITNMMAHAYRTVIKYRVLWGLGLVAALLSVTRNNEMRVSENRLRLFNVDVAPTPELVAWIVAVGLLVGITFFLLRVTFDAALIAAGDRSAREEAPPTFADAWRAGTAKIWPMVALGLIFMGFVLAVVLSVALVGGLGVATMIGLGLLGGQSGAQWSEGWGAVAAISTTVLGVLALLLAALLAGIVLAAVVQLAQRAAVLEGQPIGQALRTGWSIVKSAPGSLFRLVVGQFLVNLLVGIVVGIVLAVLAAPPAIALLTASGGAQEGALFVTLAVLLVVFAWLVSGLALALPTGWNSVLWTLFYRAATATVPHAAGPVSPYSGQLPPTVPSGL